jgi:hypothetical protein
VYCPDCGRKAGDPERFCPFCGYPLARLGKRLEREKEDSLGWAERLVGRPSVEAAPPPESPLVSFKTGPEPKSKQGDEEDARRCERCGAKADIGALCPKCGDRLPSLTEGDPYLDLVFRSFLRMTLAPKHFALSLAYPVTGGIIQPLLYPGVFAALFLLTLPLSYWQWWPEAGGPTRPFTAALVGAPLSVFGVPILVYLTSGFAHLVGQLLGGHVPFRRTIRVVGAGIIWLLVLGTVLHLARFGVAVSFPDLAEKLKEGESLERLAWLWSRQRIILATLLIVLVAWEYAWAVGGLFWLTWWKAAILLIATYWLIAVTWLFFLVILPLQAGGLL